MKQYRVLATALIIFSGLNTWTYAESRAGAATFTLAGGYIDFASKRNIDNTGIGYGTVGYDFTDHWGIEGLVGFFGTTSKRYDDYGKHISGTLFSVNGVYHFNAYNHLEPYVFAGPGVFDMRPNGTDANAQGNVNGGVGVQFFIDKSVVLRAEARDLYTIVGGKNDLMFSGGLTVLYDFC